MACSRLSIYSDDKATVSCGASDSWYDTLRIHLLGGLLVSLLHGDDVDGGCVSQLFGRCVGWLDILTLGDAEEGVLAVSNLRVGGVLVGSVSGDQNGGSGLENRQEVGGSILERGDGHERSRSILSVVVDSNGVFDVGVAGGGGQGLGGLCDSAVESHLEGIPGGGGGGEFSGESEHCVFVCRCRGDSEVVCVFRSS